MDPDDPPAASSQEPPPRGPEPGTSVTATTAVAALTTQPAAASLCTLPAEIFHHLAQYLPYPALIALSSTSRQLYHTIDPATLAPRQEKLDFYDRAEQSFPQHAHRLVCYACFRFLAPDQFGDSKRRGRSGRHGRDPARRTRRFCWPCGVAGRRYVHLRGVKRGGVLQYPCHRCGLANVSSQRCLREVCVVIPAAGIGGDSRIEGVVVGDVAERVCALLGYPDLLSLRQVSRHFRRVVDPVRQCRDVYGMWEHVMGWMKAWGWMSRVAMSRVARWNGPTACFGCFRLRSRRHFSWAQWELSSWAMHGDYWRRRCWECLRRFYHPTLADTEARARFHRQVLCGVCKCLRFADEDCRGCVVRKDEIAEWARLKQLKMATRGDYNFWETSDVFYQWFDEDAPAVLTGGESEGVDDDLWDEGIGPCLERLALGDEGFLHEDSMRSDSESLLTNLDAPDQGEKSSAAMSSSTTVLIDVWEPEAREEASLSTLVQGIGYQDAAVSVH